MKCSASVLALSMVEHVFDPCSTQTNDYKIGICCFLIIYY